MDGVGHHGAVGRPPNSHGLALGHYKDTAVLSVRGSDHAHKVKSEQQHGAKDAGPNLTHAQAEAQRAVNLKAAALRDAASTLGDPAAWRAVKAHSSSDAVAATALAGAQTGMLELDVNQLASAHSVVAVTQAGSLADPVVSGPVEIIFGDRAVAVRPLGNSLRHVIEAINGTADAGVRATAVQQESGRYALQVTATGSGAAKAFALTGLGAFVVGSQGADARVTVGRGGSAAVATSSTNTFSDVLPGVVFTARGLAKSITITAEPDPLGVSAKLKKLVDAANSALSDARVAGGPDFVTDLKKLGIELTGDKKLRYSEQAFLESFKFNHTATQPFLTRVGAGVAHRLHVLAEETTKQVTPDAVAATTTSAAVAEAAAASAAEGKGHGRKVGKTDRHADDWAPGLQVREHQLRNFALLEKSLHKLEQQTNWLARHLTQGTEAAS
jgi:flagellar hook-associated protein 2